MTPPAQLLREARRAAGLTQRDLADRLGTTQSAVAQLEAPGANPTIETLDGALRATGHRLEMRIDRRAPEVDEAQILRHLQLTPAERLAAFSASHRSLRGFLSKAKRRAPAPA